ncbi:MAG: M1 family aminopeptidase, partial [Thermoanaerobaculia bacterium]
LWTARAAAVSAGEERLSAAIERWESLRAGPAEAVSGLTLSAGHATLLLKSGTACPVRAGEEVVGLFFSGTGELEYQSADPIEFPIFAFNTKKATGLEVEQKEGRAVVRDTFQRALWLAAGQPLPSLPGAGDPSLEASLQGHLEKFRRARGITISHFFVQQKLDAPAAPRVLAALDGGKEDLVYLLDGLESRSETLVVLRKPEFPDAETKKFLYPTVLSDQPVGRDRRDPLPPLYLLTEVDLALRAGKGKEASMSVGETVVPVGQTRRIFRFDLYNSVSSADNVRTWTLQSVADAEGRPLAFDHDNGEVLVEAASPVAPDQALKLRFEIEGDFLWRPRGDSYWQLGLGGGDWFPQPDLNGQHYDFHALVRVKKPFVPFASGRTIRRAQDGDENILETRTENPVSFPAVIAGAYQWEEETKNGVTIRVATYAMKNTRAMKQLAGLAFGIIEHYQNFLGPFPFPEYNIIEINTWGFGQAPPGIMFITKEAFNPLMGDVSQLFSQGVNERFAHEIAHQYWGQVVKMPSFDEQWLTESFAEYSAAIFLKAFKGQSTYKSLVNHWKSRAAQAAKISPIPLANRISIPGDVETAFIYRNDLIYDKGSYLLAALHKEMGDQNFLTFFKSYQKSFRWKFGSTKTVEGILQWLTKKDYAPFFAANYWGTGMPAD